MSAGAFLISRYQLNNGAVVAVRVQAETEELVLGGQSNGPAAGTPSNVGSFPLNVGGKRRLPFSARSVTLKFTTTLPPGYAVNSRPKVPILQPALYNAITRNVTVGQYLGRDVIVVGKSPEVS